MGIWPLVIAVLSGAALVVYTLSSVPVRIDKTLSQHIMLSRRAVITGAILLSVIGTSLFAWIYMRQVPPLLWMMISSMAAAFIVMGVIPYGRGVRSNRIHNYAAWGSAPLMIASELLIAWLYPAVIVAIIAIVLCQLIILLLYYLVPLWRQYIVLVGQLVYFGAFFLALSAVEISYA